MVDEQRDPFEKGLRDRLHEEAAALHLPGDFWNRISRRLDDEQRAARRRRWIAGAVILAGATLGFFALGPMRRPPSVSAQQIAERLGETSGPVSVGVSSYHAMLQIFAGSTQEIWFRVADKYRVETANYIFVTDGVKMWEYHPRENSVTIREFDSDILPNQPPTSGLAETLTAGTYYTATLVGTDTVAGREAYLLELRPTFERAVNSSQPEDIEGLVKWWLDTETLFELGYEQYTTDGRLVDSRKIISIEYNVLLPEDLFVFQIPQSASVVDTRPGHEPTTAEELAKLNLGFTAFFPTYLPSGLSPKPEITTMGPVIQIELFYASKEPRTWLRIVETASENVTSEIRGEAVEIDGLEGRLQVGDGVDYPNTVIFTKEGTYIALWSLTLPPEELLAIASSMQPAD